MQNFCEKGVAIRLGPEFCVMHREVYSAGGWENPSYQFRFGSNFEIASSQSMPPAQDDVGSIKLGLRENVGQFSLLVLINIFVGMTVALERTSCR